MRHSSVCYKFLKEESFQKGEYLQKRYSPFLSYHDASKNKHTLSFVYKNKVNP